MAAPADRSAKTQAGGPAAINGFLYQILHHIDWLARVRLTSALRGSRVEGPRLVLEPRGGGDAKALAAGFYLVEQYKTRTGRTWSLAALNDVLADLRKAVDRSRAKARYRFVTNGRAGRLQVFEAFLDRAGCAEDVDDLDDTEKRAFARGVRMTDRGFFDHIERSTRGRDTDATNDNVSMLHLLSRFEMAFCVDGDALAAGLDRLLRRYASDPGQASRIRDELVGALMRRLGPGEACWNVADIDTVLREAGLSPQRAHRLARLHRTMAVLTADRLRRLNYRPGLDIRVPPDWPSDRPVLLIAGESGVGKTWQLGRLVSGILASQQVATVVVRTRDCADLLRRAAADFWESGLGETSAVTMQILANHLAEHDAAPERLVVASDDVRDVDAVRDLVHQDWRQWRMRLVLTVPDTVAMALEREDAVHVHRVRDFTVDELSEMLALHGHDWIDLPSDLQKILRKPILAGTMVRLQPASFKLAPNTEYEIFERFWGRIAERGWSGDEGAVIALGGRVLESKPYPLPFEDRGAVFPDSGALERLQTAGWLQEDDGFVSFVHDRLLNWAVAKSLAARFERRHVTEEAVAAVLARCGRETGGGGPNRLGYVPMDTLWLLAQGDQESGTLGRLVGMLEDTGAFGAQGEVLYAYLLPTLGQHGVSVLLERVRAVAAVSETDYRLSLLGKGFGALAEQEAVVLDTAVGSLLNSPSRGCRNVALAALAVAPVPGTVDDVWRLHQQNRVRMSDEGGFRAHDDYEATSRALRTGIAHDPFWLRDKIMSLEVAPDALPTLAFQLHVLDGPEAADIWRETRDVLTLKTPEAKRRGVLHCIARFLDGEMREFALQQIPRTEDFAGAAALNALSVIDPDLAIEQMAQVDEDQLNGFRVQWLPELLRKRRERTLERLLAIAETDGRGFRRIADLFSKRHDLVDAAILRFLLRTLESELAKHLPDLIASVDPIWTYFRFDFLSRVARPELLAVLEAEGGGQLESMITALACSRVDRISPRQHDGVFETARLTLLMIGGEGINEVIGRQLDSKVQGIRVNALDWASLLPAPGIAGRVAEIACGRVAGEDAAGHEEEVYHALVALAHLGPDRELVDALHRTGGTEVPPGLAELRAHRGPMPKELTLRSEKTLSNAGAHERDILAALVVAWVSADPDMIVAVRTVLEGADPSSVTARLACIALDELGDRSVEFADVVAPLLHVEDNVDVALRALSAMGGSGCDRIAGWLAQRSDVPSYGHASAAIRILYDNPGTREAAVAAALDCCKMRALVADPPWEIAAETRDPELRERMLETAFVPNPARPLDTLRAIDGLARFNVPKAVDAVRFAFRNSPNVAPQLCSTLVRIAPEGAARLLVDAAVSTEQTALREAAGRALRQLGSDPVADILVEGMQSDKADQRLAAVQIARWLPEPRIAEAVEDRADSDDSVQARGAALAALEAHRSEATVREILGTFAKSTERRQWRLLIAVLEIGDPELLADVEDELNLERVLAVAPGALRQHARNELQRRRKKARQASGRGS